MSERVVVRSITSDEECVAACEVAAMVLHSQVSGAGLNPRSWALLEAEKLVRSKPLWDHYGIALDGDDIVGMVIIRISDDRPSYVGCCEASCKVGCYGAIRSSWARSLHQDMRLDAKRNDVCVELVAVHPDYQRRGVGSKLLAWVEQQGLELLMDRFPEEIRANGSRLLLEVGGGNESGIGLFESAGYMPLGRTGKECCLEAMWSCAFGEKYFLTMTKRLSAAYQRAMQTPGAFKGKVHVVQVPMTVDMTRN